MESIRSFPSTGFGLPRVLGGSAPASAVSGPARCYCTFGLQDSPSRLKRPSSSEAPAASSPPPPLRLLPGGANQFPGGNFTRSGPAPYTAHQLHLARRMAAGTRQLAVFGAGRIELEQLAQHRRSGLVHAATNRHLHRF